MMTITKTKHKSRKSRTPPKEILPCSLYTLTSFFNHVNLKSIINPTSFDSVISDGRDGVTDLLPSHDKRDGITDLLPSCDRPRIKPASIDKDSDTFNNVFFNSACRNWMTRLKEGNLNDFLRKLLCKMSKAKPKNSRNHFKNMKYSNGFHIIPQQSQSLQPSPPSSSPLSIDHNHNHADNETDDGNSENWYEGVDKTSETFLTSKFSNMSYLQRCYYRAMHLDHGCYCRPATPVANLGNMFPPDIQTHYQLLDNSVLDKRMHHRSSTERCNIPNNSFDNLHQTFYSTNTKEDKPSNFDKHFQAADQEETINNSNGKPRFIRVILHRRHSFNCNKEQPSWTSIQYPADSENRNDRHLDIDDRVLTGIVQKLLSSKVKTPCLLPISLPQSSSA